MSDPHYRLLKVITVAVAMIAMVPAGWAEAQPQQRSDLGAMDPREVTLSIAHATEKGDASEIASWLGPTARNEVFGDWEYRQAAMLSLGRVVGVEIVDRAQVGDMSYFTLEVEHRTPIPMGVPIASLLNRKSYWLLGFDGKTGLIATILFSRDSPYFESHDSVEKAAISAVQTQRNQDQRTVELLFATTRARLSQQPAKFARERSFGHLRDQSVHLGEALIRIPEDHKIGKLELWHEAKLFHLYEEKLDLSKHFVIQSAERISWEELKKVILNSKRDEALILVHGFDTTFEEALYRGAQIVWDLQYKGIPIVFSWASWGGVDFSDPLGLARTYLYDRESAQISGDEFLNLLHVLRKELGVKRVHIVAHSMGSFAVLNALKREATATRPVKLGELVLAAPDVDRDYFLQTMPQVRPIVRGITVYASSADKALIASRQAARGVPRAGDVLADGPITVSGADTIDVTAIGDEFFGLNHDVFATNRSLIDDIGLLLEGIRPPSVRLREIRPVPTTPPPRYWRFVP